MAQIAKHRYKWLPILLAGTVVAALAIQLISFARSASAVATSATTGGSTRAIDGTNTWRGTNQMIMYTYSAQQTSVPTAMSNEWGIEVAVNGSGVITAKNDRLQSGSKVGTPIPVNGYVLSGHGWGVSTSGYTWLLQNAQVGQPVTLNGSTPTQPPSGFNTDGVKLAAPAVTVNGTNVTYSWTVETNKSVTFRYLQVAVRPAPDTGFNNNVTINGSRSFTASRAHTNGNYTAFIAYQLPNGNWVNGPSVDYTVGSTTPSDTTAPSVSLSAPGNNASVTKGDSVAIAATASDNVGVAKVEFLVDGGVANTDTSAPYSYTWDTTSANAGNHTIVAKAYDAAGNVGTSSTVNVTVTAPQPTISATATLNGDKATLSWTTTGANPAEWTVARDGTDSGGYGAWSENVPGDRRSHVFNYLRPGDTYTLTVSAADGRTASAIVTVPTTEPADTTAPTTSITSPANNSSTVVGNAVTITANASDNVGVSKVEFLVNGVVVATDTSAPYSYTWDTSGKTAGNYALTTRAYDAANNAAISSAVTITLNAAPVADTTAPSVSLTSPANGTSVTKGDTVSIVATASDNIGVTKVEFLVNGSVVGTDTSTPYTYSWNTGSVNADSYTVTAKAYDAANNTTTSTAVTVTVTQPQTGQTATQRLWGQTPRSGKAWSSGLWTAAPFTPQAINQFESFRGSNVDLVTTYAPKEDPATMANNSWSITTWNGFAGKLNVGVPMAFDNGVTISQVANGAYDAQYRQLAQNLVNSGRGDSIIRIGWEANLSDWTWHATSSNATTWKNAWRRIATQMKSVAPNLKAEFGVGCGGGLSGSSDRLAPLTMLYPGDDLVDAVGCDVYDWWSTHPTSDSNVNTTLYRAPYGPGILDIIDFAKSKGKVAGFAEWGVAKNTGGNNGGGDNPYFIQAMYNAVTANTDTVAYELYFNEADTYISSSLTNGVNPNAGAAYAARW